MMRSLSHYKIIVMRLLYLLLLANALFFMINAMENIPQKKVPSTHVRSTHPAFHQYAHEMWQRGPSVPLITGAGAALLFFAWLLFEKTIHEH